MKTETRIPSTAVREIPNYVYLALSGKDAKETKWSKSTPPPTIGETVKVTMNGLGQGVVVGYQVCGGYLGLWVRLSNPPSWWVEQNKRNNRVDYYGCALVFGAEIEAPPPTQ